MPWTEATKDIMLDAVGMFQVRLHSGDPGPNGLFNQLGAGLESATFNAASGGRRELNADVTVTGLAASQAVTHFSIWSLSGPVFRGSGRITDGDNLATAAGVFTLKAATTYAGLIDDPDE